MSETTMQPMTPRTDPATPEERTTIDRTFAALDAVRLERIIQDARWGTQRHSWPEWMCILTEEVGEAAQAANKQHWSSPPDWLPALRHELTQVAAVACAMIEHIDEMEGAPDAAS